MIVDAAMSIGIDIAIFVLGMLPDWSAPDWLNTILIDTCWAGDEPVNALGCQALGIGEKVAMVNAFVDLNALMAVASFIVLGLIAAGSFAALVWLYKLFPFKAT